MNILELFAGSRSIGKVGDKMGHTVFSVDINNFEGINLVKDIEFLEIEDIPFIPDMIWAGTPCDTYSVVNVFNTRNKDYTPKTEFGEKSDRMNVHLLELINKWQELNPDLCWYIENPMGILRKMWFMKGLNRATVTYCSYGDTRMKPTDIWSNNIYDIFNTKGWKPRAMCFNGNTKCQHEPAPRGSKTGTQGLKGTYEKSAYPYELCYEIIQQTFNKIKPNHKELQEEIEWLELEYENLIEENRRLIERIKELMK